MAKPSRNCWAIWRRSRTLMGPTNVTHYNIAQSFDVLAGCEGTDLGSVSAQIDGIIAEMTPNLPRGTKIAVRGQVQSMNTSFRGLAFWPRLCRGAGLLADDGQLSIMARSDDHPHGAAWRGLRHRMDAVRQPHDAETSPSLMGAMMCIGVATANSILLVTFANDQRQLGKSAIDAAWIAGVTRLRPVIMTALAMILGMLPMSLGFGEGGEQNAPLGRAVIGGLGMATFATLFWVPLVYSYFHANRPVVNDDADERVIASYSANVS
jgi:multidrug efflux pump subunit AcrB